ncbi:GLPGLI family protein [Chryseobacterium wangxinyae]|uniref:GLPGLI family protein n=1 Tax=Chryseobacterium sp. CY350 TaxID=2997336 RepID=UPI002271683F|nr:GLPGLI family protein [Chryseobacterium sp. CY350]MCY0978327.1 GLPGLI family protein [Chryseobacterium sp. CY350]WBZ96105.1 GLPGLI family protein [Chryseobacterium sp. CY350]
MKNLLFTIFTFSSILFYAQNQRFSYEYKFVTDSTAKDKSQTELMYLDISKKGSKFYSRDKAVADSIMDEMNKKGSNDFEGIKFGQVQSIVEKSYPDYKIYFFNRVDMDEYKVSDERKLDWKILSEKEKIGEFNTQKATTYFAGRKWIAWFTTDIPFQDGPYKFRGLPGLIVKIEDKANSHSFILKGVKNLKPDEIWISENDTKRYEPLIILSHDKYNKQVIDQRNNPTKGLRQLMARGGTVKFTDQDGKELDTSKMMREQEQRAKENNAKNNNLLELDILK